MCNRTPREQANEEQKARDRALAESEVNKDLEKPIKQLVCDVYHELLNKEHSAVSNNLERDVERIKHAFKRFGGLLARNEIENKKLQHLIIVLTVIMTIFAIIQVILSILQIYLNNLIL